MITELVLNKKCGSLVNHAEKWFIGIKVDVVN